jgi:hypothetical protein
MKQVSCIVERPSPFSRSRQGAPRPRPPHGRQDRAPGRGPHRVVCGPVGVARPGADRVVTPPPLDCYLRASKIGLTVDGGSACGRSREIRRERTCRVTDEQVTPHHVAPRRSLLHSKQWLSPYFAVFFPARVAVLAGTTSSRECVEGQRSFLDLYAPHPTASVAPQPRSLINARRASCGARLVRHPNKLNERREVALGPSSP